MVIPVHAMVDPAIDRRAGDGRLLCFDAALAAVIALAVPLALFVGGYGAVNRLLYPALAFAAAIYLFRKQSPWFVGLCLWLFCAAPLIRRLTDLEIGWDPASPVLLAPYLACLLAGLSLLPYALRDRPSFVTPFIVILIVIAYGAVVASVNGRPLSAAVDLLKWSVGPLMAVHLLRMTDMRPSIHRAVVNSLIVAGPAMGIYGAMQFIDPAIWDRNWMVDALMSQGLNSIGNPAPFEVRVFSTMNSPSSLAGMLMVAIIVTLGRPLLAAAPAVLLMMLGLALSQYRSMWAGTMLGMCYVFMAAPARDKIRLGAVGAALVFATGLLTLVPEMNRTLTSRLQTLTQLSSDVSREDRMAEWANFLERGDELLLGSGIGIASASFDGQNRQVIDNGIVEIFSAFGIFGGLAFLGAFLAIIYLMFTKAKHAPREMIFYRAVVVAGAAQLAFVRAVVGESGFGTWLFMGLALSSMIQVGPGRERRDLRLEGGS